MSITLKVKGMDKVLGRLKRFSRESPEKVKRAMYVITSKAADAARRKCPIDTGTLRTSIDNKVVEIMGEIIGMVFTPIKYGIFVHFGTGIFGPKHRYITPKHAEFLHWKGKEGWRRARKVKGQKATYFMNHAIRSIKTNAVPTFRRMLGLR